MRLPQPQSTNRKAVSTNKRPCSSTRRRNDNWPCRALQSNESKWHNQSKSQPQSSGLRRHSNFPASIFRCTIPSGHVHPAVSRKLSSRVQLSGVPMTASREKTEARKLPMMPLRDMVIFPHMMMPFVVDRESSVRALEEALTGDHKIFLATQHDASVDEPKAKEIYQVGSICNIVQSVKMPDGNIKVLVEGVERAKSIEVNDHDGFFVATVRVGKSQFEMTPAVEQLMTRVTGLFEQYVTLQQSLNYETIIATVRMDEPAKLSDTIAANLQLGVEEKQDLLAIFDPAARLARIADVLDVEIEKLDLDRNIQSRVKRQMERAQKEYYLNEKIKAIQKELGRGEKSEFDELRKKIEV